MTVRDVDEVDLRLVRYMLDHPRASYAELSRSTGIAESTVKRRVAALIDTRVITPAIMPDVRRLGFETRALVGIKVDLNYIEETAEIIRDLPEVTSLHMVMGRFDLHAAIAARDLDGLSTFVITKIAPLPGIRDIETFVSSRTIKSLSEWRLPASMFLGTDGASGET